MARNGKSISVKIEKKQKLLTHYKDSQFSHKQLVLVTAPVSTGAFLLKNTLAYPFPLPTFSPQQEANPNRAQTIRNNVPNIKTPVGNEFELDKFHRDSQIDAD